MPTVLRSGPYRFFFYTGDGGEPPHVHVERDDCEAKFWLDPVRLERKSRIFAERDQSFTTASRGAPAPVVGELE
jgi:hypothetical protein